MTSIGFVGRVDAAAQLADALARKRQFNSKLVIQSVEGPGGIGKTALLEHVLSRTHIDALNYLMLKINSDEDKRGSLTLLVRSLIDSASPQPTGRRPANYFPDVEKVLGIIEEIRAAAAIELQKKPKVIQPALQILRIYLKSYWH
jgi:predicted ATPase